ncbi:hypothetical protein ACS0TY_003333 [Phlomoides rotata]
MSRSSSFLLSNPSNQDSFKQISAEGEFLKSKEFMGSDYFQNQNQHTSGLARYRSAPSSLFATLLDSNTDNSSSGDEAEAFFSSLIDGPKNSDNQMQQQQYPMKQESGVEVETRPGFQTGGYDSVVNGGGGSVVGSYSVGMENQLSNGNGNRNGSNLIRQSSSPAGFFNGFGIMGEVGNYRVQNHAEVSSSSTRFMPSIPENGNGNDSITPGNNRLRNADSANSQEFDAAYPHDSWNDTSFNTLKRNHNGDPKMFSNFNELENQNGEATKRTSGLVSHMSLPKTSAEMAVVENYLQFQQETTVPCQVRAKRGFATHPRSIAERMRRTRISKNIKKLQDLFPDMDKQTNTADMLDLAVDYIKDLQKQVQALTDTKGKCVCSSKSQQKSPTT